MARLSVDNEYARPARRPGRTREELPGVDLNLAILTMHDIKEMHATDYLHISVH